jgi:hypothetical protein
MAVTFVNSTTIPFMYTGNYTWYDTRVVTDTTIPDQGPGGFTATLNQALPAVPGPYPGMIGRSFAANPRMTCPTGYTSSGNFTLSFWAFLVPKSGTGVATYQYIFNEGRLTVHQYVGNTDMYYEQGGGVAFPQAPNVWTLLTYVYRIGIGITAYKNGTQVSFAAVNISAAAPFNIGGYSLSFIGNLCDIRITSTLLTANQVSTLYQSYINGTWSTNPPSSTQIPQMRLSNQFVIVKQTTTFLATGAVQTFTVPAGVNGIRFFLWGAGGLTQNGNQNSYAGQGGGSGAYMEGNLQTTPGTTYSIIVGGSGQTTLAWGGGSQSRYGGGGGGFSGIFSSSPAAGTVIAIAGGGGGGGTNGGGSGGGGGYPSGGDGVQNIGTSGKGGTQISGGTGAVAGSQLAGGSSPTADGGGGGGGWYGGGAGTTGGVAPGGGGGSSTFISSVITPVNVNGNVGATVTGVATLAANESSPYWVSPYGRSGQSGLVIIGYNTSETQIRMSHSTPLIAQTFAFTGATQTFIVPSGKVFVYIYMWGAGGGGVGGSGNGAAGAMVQGVLKVLSGQILTVIVGGGGNTTASSSFGGGGTGGNVGNGTSGSGGGRSAIQINSTDVVTAGGGGGSGYPSNAGGSATFSGTANAGTNPTSGSGTAGGGGTQTSGGAAGASFCGSAVSAGSQFLGGNGGGQGCACGGGGGGGWYGGGGGGSSGGSQAGGGGGGSSYTENLQAIPGQTVFGFNSSNGNAAPNTSSPYYTGVIGRGGNGSSTAGGNGLVVIVY